jgi:hypothetical protein
MSKVAVGGTRPGGACSPGIIAEGIDCVAALPSRDSAGGRA